MLKRELKVNFKGFLIWSGITIMMFLVVFLVYPLGYNIKCNNK